MSSRGFVRLPVVISIALAVGFAASVFLNINQHQQAAQDKKLLQGEITDLRYQVNQDKLAVAGSPSPSPSATPLATPEASSSPSPSPAATVLAASSKTASQICAPDASFRSDAKANAGLIARVPKGTVVTLGTDIQNKYQQVTYNGKAGYILVACLQ